MHNFKEIGFRYKRAVLISLMPVVLMASNGLWANEIKPFTTDGCSVFPDGTLEDNAKWMECCIRHDFAYWKGGTRFERERADNDLQVCVEGIGEKDLSDIMLLGVRLGGSPFYPTWYRWGYGWPYLRGYEALTKEEEQQVQLRLLRLRNIVDSLIEKPH